MLACHLLTALLVFCHLLYAVQSLSVENLVDVWQASEDYSAPQLAKRCVLFALEHVTEIIAQYSGVSVCGATAVAAAIAAAAPPRSMSAASSSSQCTGSQGTGSPCSSSGSQVGAGLSGMPLNVSAYTQLVHAVGLQAM